MKKSMENKDNNVEIVVTDHALSRLRERSGLNAKAAQKLAERSYFKGLKHSDTKGNLFKYINTVTLKSNKGSDIRIYGDKVYVFNKAELNESNKIKLVTVLQLPQNLIKLSLDIKEDKKR